MDRALNMRTSIRTSNSWTRHSFRRTGSHRPGTLRANRVTSSDSTLRRSNTTRNPLVQNRNWRWSRPKIRWSLPTRKQFKGWIQWITSLMRIVKTLLSDQIRIYYQSHLCVLHKLIQLVSMMVQLIGWPLLNPRLTFFRRLRNKIKVVRYRSQLRHRAPWNIRLIKMLLQI